MRGISRRKPHGELEADPNTQKNIDVESSGLTEFNTLFESAF
jgi:hypothetical protein